MILAHRTPVRHRRARRCSTAATPVHVVLPAYNAVRTIPDVVKEMPVGAANRALLIDDASPDETTRVAIAHGLDVLRHPANRGYGASQKTGYVRALRDGADGRRDGPRRQPVRPGAGGRDGRADPRRGGRRRDRLAAARRPRDRGRDAALEVARQPAADRDREPRLRRALLRVPHGLPRVQRRLPALDPVPAQLRRLRLRPGDLRPDARAAGAGGGDPDPDALLPRGVIGRLPHQPALRAQDAVVLARFRLDRRWALLRRPAACIAPPSQG